MTTPQPPGKLPAAVCRLAAHAGDSETLRQAGQSDRSAVIADLLSRLEELKRDRDSDRKTEWIAAERARIAQELHDRVAQTLFSLGLTADWMLAHVDEGEPLRPEIERLKKMAGTALAQVREAIFSLSSPPVEPTQFRAAVHNLLGDLEQAGIAGDLRLWGDLQQLSPQVTDALYQIVREALINVRRHAKATHVLVSVRTLADRVVAVIQDDGQGIAPEVLDTYRKNGAHWGLRGMESRVERLGGTLTLAPGDECGLIVTAAIPLRGAE